MDFKKLFKNNDNAVSPVIGVILMVAITVILAAAIGSSVFSHGNIKSAPQANLDIKAVSAYDASATPKQAVVKIEHLGGDTIHFEDSGANITATLDGEDSVRINAEKLGEFTAGDVKTLQLIENDKNNTAVEATKGKTVNIKISDPETNQLICDKDVKF